MNLEKPETIDRGSVRGTGTSTARLYQVPVTIPPMPFRPCQALVMRAHDSFVVPKDLEAL